MNGEVLMFVNGQAMRGGPLNDALSEARFVSESMTAPRYRFHSVRDEFPGLSVAGPDAGRSIRGEVYEVTYAILRERLLPREPPELELSVIELDTGLGCLSMRMRDGYLDADGVVDITEYGGWRAYLSASR